MTSRHLDHAFKDIHFCLLPAIYVDFKFRTANGNYRAGSAELKWLRTTGTFGDERPYASQQ